MKRGLTIGTAVLVTLTLAACGNSASSKAESSSSASASRASESSRIVASKKESESDKKAHPLDHLSTRKLAEYNKGLAASLIEDQGFANNGKNEYAWSTYVDSVSYSSRGLIGNVNSDFIELDDSGKTKVGQGLQGLAGSQIVIMDIDLAADAPAIYTNIHYNGDRIGHSKSWHPSEFTWSN